MLKQRLLMAASHAGTPPGGTTLYSMGSNGSGVTAQNTTSGNSLVPTVAVDSHNTWTKVVIAPTSSSAGNGTGIGLLSNGTLWTWGSNFRGGAGSGSAGQGSNSNNYLVPTQVGSVTTWTDIAGARYGGLAVRSNGTLWSWGTDNQGELGQGGSFNVVVVPTQVGSGTTWSKVFSGFWTTFLIDTSGKLYALGTNDSYATGLGTQTGNTLTPTQVGSATNWVSVSTTPYGAIGIQSNGTAWSWGTDLSGELCQGSSGGTYTTPTQIGTGTHWIYAATDSYGGSFSFLIQNVSGSKTLWTAGNNTNYQTGLGTNSGNTTTLTQVGSATNWVSVVCLNEASQDVFP